MKRKFLIFRWVFEVVLGILLTANFLAGVVVAVEQGGNRASLRGYYFPAVVIIWLSVLLILDASRIRKSLRLPSST